MKVRLTKGPFAGKVMDHPHAGSNRIVIQGNKPMTRKQRWEFEREFYSSRASFMMSPGYIAYPQVRAEYRLALRMHGSMVIPCIHPDGSYFYEHIKPGS